MRLSSREGPIAPKGASSADEIFLAVGSALSWWEGAEDELLRLFRALHEPHEEERVAKYTKSMRGRRSDMMEAALTERAQLLSPSDLDSIRAAIDALKGLVTRRNQISHGHCTLQHRTENGVVVMEGHYLVPAWNEVGPFDREIRFALTVEDITSFREAVREARWAIIQVAWDLQIKQQEQLQEECQKIVDEQLKIIAEGATIKP